MPGNPNISLGTLNRLVASVTFPNFPGLNVTPPFLGRRAIQFTPEGDVVTFINALTGMITSPEPYLGVTITMNLVRTQNLAAQWQTQWLSLGLIGPCTVRPDVPASAGGLQPFDVQNVGILRVGGMGFDGEDGGLPIVLRGTYYVNSDLWPS
jgi:hypothetical protein